MAVPGWCRRPKVQLGDIIPPSSGCLFSSWLKASHCKDLPKLSSSFGSPNSVSGVNLEGCTGKSCCPPPPLPRDIFWSVLCFFEGYFLAPSNQSLCFGHPWIYFDKCIPHTCSATEALGQTQWGCGIAAVVIKPPKGPIKLVGSRKCRPTQVPPFLALSFVSV